MKYDYEYAIDDFLARQYDECRPALPASLAVSGQMSRDTWRVRFREKFLTILGGFPEDAPPLDIKILNKEKIDGITRIFFTFESERGLTVPAYYLLPDGKNGPLPSVIAADAHGYGVRDIVGLDEDGNGHTPERDVSYQKTFALELCRKGFAVIAPEMFGFGHLRTRRSIDTHPQNKSCLEATKRLQMTGRTTSGVRVFECRRALEVLEQFGDADMERVGCMGLSGGGQTTTFFTALDDRVKACVVSGFASVYKTSVMKLDNHCVDSYFTGLLKLGELPDILSLIAPRPMLWEIADRDQYFPAESALEAAGRVREAYASLGAADNFEIDEFSGTHQISGAKAYDFLMKRLAK